LGLLLEEGRKAPRAHTTRGGNEIGKVDRCRPSVVIQGGGEDGCKWTNEQLLRARCITGEADTKSKEGKYEGYSKGRLIAFPPYQISEEI